MERRPERAAHRPSERLKDCLSAMALGDALGFHVEGRAVQEAQALAALMRAQPAQAFRPEVLAARFDPLTDWITQERYQSGQITDDTQMACLLARAYAGPRAQAQSAFAHALARGFADGAFVAYGRTTQSAAGHIASGRPFSECGLRRASNGAAMRTAPLGVLFAQAPDRLAACTREQTLLTHTHPESVDAALAQSFAVRALIHLSGQRQESGQGFSVPRFLALMRAGAPESVCTHLDTLLAVDDAADAAAYCLALDRERQTAHYGAGHVAAEGLSSAALPCVLWSIYAFAHTPENAWQSLATALSIGGDTDTVAAMTGAMCGVYHGASAVPGRARRWLHDRGVPWETQCARALVPFASAARAPDMGQRAELS